MEEQKILTPQHAPSVSEMVQNIAASEIDELLVFLWDDCQRKTVEIAVLMKILGEQSAMLKDLETRLLNREAQVTGLADRVAMLESWRGNGLGEK